jgi:hypothetical protein
VLESRQMIPVNSSSIRAVDYDGNHLFVQFHNSDTIYDHPNVPYDVYEAFMNTPSMGAYYNRHIRGRYK